jgi:hypothetical protein
MAQDATYKIEFLSNWSSATHPNDYPSGSAHWSPLIGTTHKDVASFIGTGMIATDGVEEVAESGATTILTQEINTLISAGTAYELINGSGLGSGPGTIIINDVNVDANFPNITLLTMIAPSPDWIAMLSNLKLTDASDNWLTSISVDVYVTDAGTDAGTTYTSTDANINPRININSLQNTPPFSDQIIGTFTFTLQQVLSVSNNTLENNISLYPNPTKGTVIIKNLGTVTIENAEIYATNGKKLREYNKINSQQNLELNSLPSGLYFLKLNSDKGSITKKIIIQ